uniref:Interferon regulatory factor like protein n=1 Tax=Ciona intestinalis TaxID=7719 RepID=Q4H3B1_CIOIN|nr:interferon regulatory factor like protein [Ciona intestinalis]BAE06516.1 interferon regulatory factor like protein [Ciona intestinalis]|eukprot:NP_001071744.1 interferon regulatory factor like protein [Ciona intestinalis]
MFKLKMYSPYSMCESFSSDRLKNSDNLQFKPWLIEQISSGNYPGLEWIDSEQQRVFKLPWTKKNYPGWEDHHKIFKAWAEHRSFIRNQKPPTQHVSLMKSNFRTILRKCRDLEEQTNLHQLGLQTGNYKVYKVLTPEETAVKKGRTKGRQQTVQPDIEEEYGTDIVDVEILSDDISNWIPDVHTIPDNWGAHKISNALNMGVIQNDRLGEKRGSSPSVSVEAKRKYPRLREQQQEEEVVAPQDSFTYHFTAPINGNKIVEDFIPKEVVFLPGATFSQPAPDDGLIPVDGMKVEVHEEQLEEDKDADGFKMLLHAAEISAGPTRELHNKGNRDIYHLLDILGIPRDELRQYSLRVKYQQHEVLERDLMEMNLGYRIHYGDPDQQCYLMKIDEPQRSELIVDFERPAISLPQVKTIGGKGTNGFQKVLKNTDAGLVFTQDEDHNLFCKRLCQSRVFAFSRYGEDNDDKHPIKLEREATVLLFNLNLFITDWINCLKTSRKREAIDHSIHLSLGKKPETRRCKTFIGLKLIPKVAETLLALLTTGNSDSVEVSVENQLDQVLRLFDID